MDFVSETHSFEHVYVELNKLAAIAPNFIAGMCPPLKEGKVKHHGKMVDALFVDDGLNEGLIKDLCSGNIF